MGCIDENGDFLVDEFDQKIWARDCEDRQYFGWRHTRVMYCEACFISNRPHLVERDADACKDLAIVVMTYAITGACLA